MTSCAARNAVAILPATSTQLSRCCARNSKVEINGAEISLSGCERTPKGKVTWFVRFEHPDHHLWRWGQHVGTGTCDDLHRIPPVFECQRRAQLTHVTGDWAAHQPYRQRGILWGLRPNISDVALPSTAFAPAVLEELPRGPCAQSRCPKIGSCNRDCDCRFDVFLCRPIGVVDAASKLRLWPQRSHHNRGGSSLTR